MATVMPSGGPLALPLGGAALSPIIPPPPPTDRTEPPPLGKRRRVPTPRYASNAEIIQTLQKKDSPGRPVKLESQSSEDGAAAFLKRKRSASFAGLGVVGRTPRLVTSRRTGDKDSVENLTAEVLNVLQTRSPLTYAEILRAVARNATPEKEAQVAKVLEVLRVTPLVNLIRDGTDEKPSYIFLDGQRKKQAVELASVIDEVAVLHEKQDELQARIDTLSDELDALGEQGTPQQAEAILKRLLKKHPLVGEEDQEGKPLVRLALLAARLARKNGAQ